MTALASCTVGFVGSGNMAEALIRGLLNANALPATSIIGADRRADRLAELEKVYGIKTTPDNKEAAQADVVVLSVKPQIISGVLKEVGAALKPGSLVVSIAAGIPLDLVEPRLTQTAGRPVAVCRAMPNTPAIVGSGATAFAAGSEVSAEHVAQTQALFDAVGLTVQLDESLLDAVTGLSGSGPAYVFMIIEALSDAGVKVGLPRYQAQKLAAHTVLGSAKMLIETGEHPGVLKDQVTSPGGTAIAGLHTLEEGGLRTTLINAVTSATDRARELGEAQKMA